MKEISFNIDSLSSVIDDLKKTPKPRAGFVANWCRANDRQIDEKRIELTSPKGWKKKVLTLKTKGSNVKRKIIKKFSH